MMHIDRITGRGESGQIIIFVLVVFMLVTLVIPPLVGFSFTARRTADIREARMLSVYAADIGIEDGYHKFTDFETYRHEFPQYPGDDPYPANISGVNGYDVDTEIYFEGDDVYRILSTATSELGRTAKVESYVSRWDYWDMFDNALTSYGSIQLMPGADVEGNVTLNGELDNKGTIDGNVTRGVPGWPDADELIQHYLADLGNVTDSPFLDSIIDVKDTSAFGPLYREDGTLSVLNSGDAGLTITANGTIYVADTVGVKYDLQIGATAHDFRLELANQTIFCEGGIEIGGKCTLKGPGCIIAVGDFYFQPKIEGAEFSFIMSVAGEIQAQPNGDFWGAIAGDMHIQMQPGAKLRWTEHPDNLNFPKGPPLPQILSYIILE